MSLQNGFIPPELYEYILSSTLRPDPLLEELRAETASHPMARMQISPDQGQFMALLTRLIGATRAIEVGVFTGYSSLCVARELPPDGLLVACDVSDEFTGVARRYWDRAGVSDRIDLRIGPAADTLEGLIADGQGDGFDLAFIDADKESYPTYYERCLELVRPGGLVLVDNALWGGTVTDPESEGKARIMRGVNAHAGADERVDVSLLAIGDGLLLARKR
jgi:predicted O-methyltransferase YrrM